MRDPGLKPDVDDVAFLGKRRPRAIRAREVRWEERRDVVRPPHIRRIRKGRSLGAKALGNEARDIGIDDRLVAALTHERWNRRAPRALTRYTPLGMILDHLRHPPLAPRRHPRNARDAIDDLRTQAIDVHRDEPLRRRAEDHRILATPAMRIRVFVRFARDEMSRGAQILD